MPQEKVTATTPLPSTTQPSAQMPSTKPCVTTAAAAEANAARDRIAQHAARDRAEALMAETGWSADTLLHSVVAQYLFDRNLSTDFAEYMARVRRHQIERDAAA